MKSVKPARQTREYAKISRNNLAKTLNPARQTLERLKFGERNWQEQLNSARQTRKFGKLEHTNPVRQPSKKQLKIRRDKLKSKCKRDKLAITEN